MPSAAAAVRESDAGRGQEAAAAATAIERRGLLCRASPLHSLLGSLRHDDRLRPAAGVPRPGRRRGVGGAARVHGRVPAAAGPRPLQDQRQLQDVGGGQAHVRGRRRASGRARLGGGDGRRHQHAGALRHRVHALRLLDGLLPPGRDRAVDHRHRVAGGGHGHGLHRLDVGLPERRARRRLLAPAAHHQRARPHQRRLHQRRALHLREAPVAPVAHAHAHCASVTKLVPSFYRN